MPKRTRGNKQGSVYYRKDRKCWVIQITVGWKVSENKEGHIFPILKRYSGYKSKKEAVAALNLLLTGIPPVEDKSTLDDVFKRWKESYSPRVKPKTMEGYVLAYNHFKPLKYRRIATITAPELQKCMDDCTAGKRTHQMMKVTAGLIWAYALDLDIVKKNVTDNLYIGKHKTTKRKPLTPQDIEAIKGLIGTVRYADYVYALCYLGYRPGEFLEITKDQVKTETVDKEEVYYIVEGIKTEAGEDRIVVIPKQILPIIKERLAVQGTDYLFPMYCYRIHTTEFTGFKKMSTKYFNDSAYKPIAKQLGIEGKSPYSARHSYANKLKKAEGDDKDKAALIGHTNFDFTRRQYMSSELEDLKAVVDSIK